MASPKKKPKAKPKRGKRPTDQQLLRKLFPKEVVEEVETQLRDSGKRDEE